MTSTLGHCYVQKADYKTEVNIAQFGDYWMECSVEQTENTTLMLNMKEKSMILLYSLLKACR